MKRNLVFALTLSLTLAFSTAAFAESSTEAASETETTEAASEASTEEPDVKSEGVMTYDEYVDAELDSEVVIEAYVQAKQSWW